MRLTAALAAPSTLLARTATPGEALYPPLPGFIAPCFYFEWAGGVGFDENLEQVNPGSTP